MSHEVFKPQQSLSIAGRMWWEWLIAMAVFAITLLAISKTLSGIPGLLTAGLMGWLSWLAGDFLKLIFPYNGLYWLYKHLSHAHYYLPVGDKAALPILVDHD